MKLLLMAGLGPYFKSREDLVGSFFDPDAMDHLQRDYRPPGERGLRLGDLSFQGPTGTRHSLLRPEQSGSLSLVVGELREIERADTPNLVAFTLRSILHRAGLEHEYFPLDAVWDGTREPDGDDVDLVMLSTTFICDRGTLARAVEWIADRFPSRRIIVGGQFTNLKYRQVLLDHPEVVCVVRGDAEKTAPRVIAALRAGDSLADIPNLAFRDDDGRVTQTPIEYIDLDGYPSPDFPGKFPIVPYESMRGCPFTCKFCSFPAASPKWRYKSAEKIARDWAAYVERNGAQHIRAMDSTFTVPPRRLRQLLRILPDVGVGWEAFTRANSLLAPGIIEDLAAAHCRTLSIGFESMSENTLKYMDKKVRATQNRGAFELLRKSDVNYRISFMVGYPGESGEDYQDTHDFLTHDYAGHFQLYVFSLQDETMPVWDDRERFQIQVADERDPDYQWSHIGMDVTEAKRLRAQTLREVRWRNDAAVAMLWQPGYQTPLLPHRSAETNYRVEKTVERLGMLPLDHPSPRDGAPLARRLLDELRAEGIDVASDRQAEPADAVS